jgi:hypothetical protein
MTDAFETTYVATRRQLRGIAESLVAGPQHRAAGTIRLAVRTGSTSPGRTAVPHSPARSPRSPRPQASITGRPTGCTPSSTRCP